jgi:hypothetical protein
MAGTCLRLVKARESLSQRECCDNRPGSRENTHQLFKRFEWLAEIKFNIHLADVDEIGGEGGEMIGIVPLPGRSLGR